MAGSGGRSRGVQGDWFATDAGDGVDGWGGEVMGMMPEQACAILEQRGKLTEEERLGLKRLIIRMDKMLMDHWQTMWASPNMRIVDAFASAEERPDNG